MARYECTASCEDCGVDLVTAYEASGRHTEDGLCHGVGVVHLEAFQGHAIRHRLVAEAEADARRAADAEAEQDRRRREAEFIRHQRREKAGVIFAAASPEQRRRIIRG